MRLCVVCWLPLDPADSGYKRRVTALYRRVAELTEVLVLSPGGRPEGLPWRRIDFGDGDRKSRGGDPLRPKQRILLSLSKRFGEVLTKAIEDFGPDFVIAEGLWAAPGCRASVEKLSIPWGITVHNIEALSARGVYLPPLPWALWQFEKRVYRKANRLFAMTLDEACHLQRALEPRPPRVTVVPNGTELPPQVSRQEIAALRESWHIREDERIGLFVGKPDYAPNRKGLEWFSRAIFPKIGDLGFRTRWIAVGSPAPRAPIPPFEFVGYLEDLHVALAAADCCISPVRHGSGTSIKILDYFASARPVVATPRAVRGLPVIPDRQALVSEDPEEFARFIRMVFLDRDLVRTLGLQGRDLVEGQFLWSTIAENLVWEVSKALGMPHSLVAGTPIPE
ncbi:MAG: hypothetical protein GHCLOJNM_02954 [bacterium]|nr:hypothetical protein [bacterium]